MDALQHPWMLKAAALQRQREAEQVEARRLSFELPWQEVDSAPESPRHWPALSKEHIHVPTPEKPRSFDPPLELTAVYIYIDNVRLYRLICLY